MKIIEQSHAQLVIRFGDAILPAVVFVVALVIGLAFAIYGSASDLVVFVVVGALFAFAGLLRLIMEQHITLTFDRMAGILNIRQRRYLIGSEGNYRLRDIRRVDAICANGQPVADTPPTSVTRCDLVIDFEDLPDYTIKRNMKRDDAATAVRLIRQFLEWD